MGGDFLWEWGLRWMDEALGGWICSRLLFFRGRYMYCWEVGA